MLPVPPTSLITESPDLVVQNWGYTAYSDALARQERIQLERLAGTSPDTLVLTEHAPVYTLGLRSESEKNILWSRERLIAENIQLAPTGRGGDITYHGPGQLIAYPIVSLATRRDLHAYLRFLEDVILVTLARHHLPANRRAGLTGIWIGERKLAAIGVSVRRWITMHGLALNVAPNLAHFGGIVPCGIAATEGSVTSLASELGPACPSLATIADTLAAEFTTRWPLFLAQP
jgi:lipoyl(octanoyl) transferase